MTDILLNVFNSLPDVERHNDNNIVVNGNSLTVLKTIKKKSIDLIFADPPYNIGKDFGNNKDNWSSISEYISWCKEWIDLCFSVLKDDGTFYFMTATQHMPFLDAYVQEKYHVVCRIVWTYDSSGVQSKSFFGSLYEPILMCTKNKNSNYTFNYENIMVDAPTGSKRKLIDYRKNPPEPYNTKKIPGNVWYFPRVRFKMDEYENHPTQKPESLLTRIILASSNPGDLVLDPFSGSFTTSAVASSLGRKSIGIDMNFDYFLIGVRRLHISNEYEGQRLIKIKKRVTKNLSKKDRKGVSIE